MKGKEESIVNIRLVVYEVLYNQMLNISRQLSWQSGGLQSVTLSSIGRWFESGSRDSYLFQEEFCIGPQNKERHIYSTYHYIFFWHILFSDLTFTPVYTQIYFPTAMYIDSLCDIGLYYKVTSLMWNIFYSSKLLSGVHTQLKLFESCILYIFLNNKTIVRSFLNGENIVETTSKLT